MTAVESDATDSDVLSGETRDQTIERLVRLLRSEETVAAALTRLFDEWGQPIEE